MTDTLEDLFAHNRSWSARMERDRPGFFTSLVKQQTPKYMWIGCSDSRVPANQITGLEPGEVFVHRNVANIVVHSDLNALSAIQFAVERLKVRHIMVVGHYGCAGVQAALEGARIGLADNWIRHIQDVRDRHRVLLNSLPEQLRADALCELNVTEQVVNVALSTVMVDAWSRDQIRVTIHGWAFGVHDGLLQDLGMTLDGTKPIETMYRPPCSASATSGASRAELPRSKRPGRGHRAANPEPMFPQRLDSPLAYDIAKAMRDGFNRHYLLFRAESARAKHRFETADWHGQQRAQRERIEFYDLRVGEAVARLEKEFKAGEQPMDVWHQVKLHFIGLLVDHHQPELAESFFNSVTTKILHRAYFQNDFIFVRPAISTEYIEPRDAPTYRAYYPERDTLGRHDRARARGLRVAGQLRRTGGATPSASRRPSSGASTRSSCGPTSSCRCCRACSIATRAPTWSARSSTASSSCPSRCRSCTTRKAASSSTPRCSARTTCRCCSASRAPTSWSTWKCPRPTCSSCAR